MFLMMGEGIARNMKRRLEINKPKINNMDNQLDSIIMVY
jgi:hypothetical protein